MTKIKERPAGALWLSDVEKLLANKEYIELFAVRSSKKVYNIFLDKNSSLSEGTLNVRNSETDDPLGKYGWCFSFRAYNLITHDIKYDVGCYIFKEYWNAYCYFQYCKNR